LCGPNEFGSELLIPIGTITAKATALKTATTLIALRGQVGEGDASKMAPNATTSPHGRKCSAVIKIWLASGKSG
jgi:hypothetical protein